MNSKEFSITGVRELAARSDIIISLASEQQPYIDNKMINSDCRLIVNISLVDFAHDVISNSKHIVVDDFQQNARSTKPFRNCLESGMLEGKKIFEMGEVLSNTEIIPQEGRVFVNPIGMGIEDLYFAQRILQLGESHDLLRNK